MRLPGAVAAAIAIGATAVSPGAAQPAPTPRAATPSSMTADAPAIPADVPLQCWWRASSGAIRVGEIVDVALTCAVLDSAAVTAVPDESRLTVAAVQLSPFEIVDGTRPPDVRLGDRRFFQYRYRLRLINPDVIGRDVKLPPLVIAYRLESRVGADATLAGRELVHQMPQLVVRVVSQVPADADDIRDSSDASLAEIAALRFRARAWRVAATVLTVLGVVFALSAFAPAAGWWRRRRPATTRRVSDRRVLAHAARVLGERLDDSRGAGWTGDGLAAALAAARVVAAVAIGAGVRERTLDHGATEPEGRLVLGRRFNRPATAFTTHVTADHVTRALAALPSDASDGERARLTRLRDALAGLTRARYGAGEALDAAAVDEAVTAARNIGLRMAREQLTLPRHWLGRPAAAPQPAAEF